MIENLSAEQQKFVDIDNHDVLVSASAGSGKTTTMIEKLTNLIIKKRVPVANLLVVTYTEAAASEMKQKLYLGLQESIKNLQLSDEDMQYYYEQLFNIATADVGTLHSICRRIVSKYFYVVNVEPAFGILSSIEINNLFNTALDVTFEKYISDNDVDFYNLYDSFNDKRNNKKLKTIITKIYDFLTQKSDSTKYIQFCLNDCLDDDIDKNICVQYIYNYYNLYFKDYIEKLKNISSCVGDEKLSKYLQEFVNGLTIVVGANNLRSLVNNVLDFKTPTLYKPKDEQYLNIHTQLQNMADGFKKELTKFKQKYTDFERNFANNTNGLKNVYKKLFEVTLKVSDAFDKLKMEVGKLTFDDLQKYAYLILQNEDIRKEISQNYKYIFVDEYQDINQIQEDILLLISNNNLNMIGDVKQSIYAFRQCMPEIFLEKYNKYNGLKSDNLIKLNKNYRCSSDVVDFVNMCFDQLITNDTIGINYIKDSRLIEGSGNTGSVNLRLINVGGDTDDSELASDEAEALSVANIISEVYDKEYFVGYTKETKHIDFKDIAILLRDGRGYISTLCKVLSSHNIPISATLKKEIFDSIEVKVIYSLLKLLGNTNQDIDMCNVLMCPLVNMTNQELCDIRKSTNCESFVESVNSYQILGKNDIIVEKINKYNNLISELKYNLKFSTIFKTINNLLINTRLDQYYLSLPYGNERWENINQFLLILNNSAFEYNIEKCLEFLSSIENKDDFVINVGSGENSVKIITMHRSKGLEYLCVIVSNLGKNFNNQISHDDVVMTNMLGLGINYRNNQLRSESNTIQKYANVLYKSKQEKEEQIRLLYVALTRARNFLYITGTYNFDKVLSNQNKNIFDSNNFLSLILKSINGHSLQGFINVLPNFDITYNQKVIANVNITNIEDITKTTSSVDNPIILGKFDKQVVDRLKSNFEKSKPKAQEKLATKTSVSTLLHEDDFTNNSETMLEIGFTESDNISLKIGNAYHRFMQKLNYTEDKTKCQNILDSMIKSGEIEKEIVEFIDIEKLWKAKVEVSKLITPTTKILKEQQFLYKTNYNNIVKTSNNGQNILIQGIIDLVLIDGDNAILIDFKTNKTKDISKLINSYSMQLQVYKNALESGLNVHVYTSKLYLFEMSSFIEVI